MEKKLPIKCPYCGCETIVELTKVTRSLLVSGLIEDTTESGAVVYDKDDINYDTTSDSFAYDCFRCGHRWESLTQLVKEMENK